ncbi:hypothetical protein E2F48_01250 [Arthrobacter crusticola]|uniref:Uncharacterized protein n=1 Tax=Arthrobacter crusticola TaxID=2547960 RepID=A0A4R5U2E6_9MICC|nr:hypothetical protein [Arthrobacter crusticola]TDK27787.1 hypothetical protein E2F48_01250 [Arthrobacter crusticola]
MIWSILGGPINGGAFGAYWFMPALFFSAIMFRTLERLPFTLRLPVIAGATTATYLYGPSPAPLPMSLGVAGSALIVMVAGHGLQRPRPTNVGPIRFGAILLVTGAAPILAGVSARLDRKHGDLGTPVLSVASAILISSGLILIFEGIFTRLPVPAN